MKKKMILLVEDNALLRECLVEAITPHHQVIVAHNGKDALQQYERHAADIHLILTDLEMPEMNGAGLVEAIRRRTDTLPIMVMTSNGADALATVLRFKQVAMLLKPFGTETLLQRIERLLAAEV